MRFGLLLTSVHDRSVPPGQQIAEHQELISLAVDAGMDLVVAGQHLVNGGGLSGMDVEAILQKADDWAERITVS
mgnify:CR=1 FL=1